MTTGRVSARQRRIGQGPEPEPPASDSQSVGGPGTPSTSSGPTHSTSSGPTHSTSSGPTWIEMVPLDAIDVPSGYIESEYDDERRAGLNRSMQGAGQDTAISVILLDDGRYVLTGGKHRCEEVRASGGSEIRAEVKRGTMRDARRMNIANALNQSQPSAWSVIEGLGTMDQDGELTVAEMQLASGCSPMQIEDRLNIWYHADAAVQEALRDKLILLGHASALAQIEDLETQRNLLPQIFGGMSVKELQDYIRNGLEDPEDEDPDGDTHEVNFTARDNPPSRSRRTATCSGCGADNETAEVQTMAVCSTCAQRFRDVVEGAPEGMVILPAGLVREALNILPGLAIGVPVADRLEKFLEGDDEDDG